MTDKLCELLYSSDIAQYVHPLAAWVGDDWLEDQRALTIRSYLVDPFILNVFLCIFERPILHTRVLIF